MTERNTLDNAIEDAYRDSWLKYRMAYAPTQELRAIIEKAEKEELDEAKRKIIENFAENHQGIADVVKGKATFYSYGGPILEHVKNVEEHYEKRRFGFVSRRALCGRDSNLHTSRAARDAFNYLTTERILDSESFFTPKLVYPGSATFERWVENTMGYVGGVLLVSSAVASIGACKGYVLGEQDGAFLGAAIGFLLPNLILGVGLPLISQKFSRCKISKQRERFEAALKSLDSHIRGDK